MLGQNGLSLNDSGRVLVPRGECSSSEVHVGPHLVQMLPEPPLTSPKGTKRVSNTSLTKTKSPNNKIKHKRKGQTYNKIKASTSRFLITTLLQS